MKEQLFVKLNKKYAKYGVIALLLLYIVCIYRRCTIITGAPLTGYLLDVVGLMTVFITYLLVKVIITDKAQDGQKKWLGLRMLTYLLTVIVAADCILTDSLNGMLLLAILTVPATRYYEKDEEDKEKDTKKITINKFLFRYILVFLLTGEVFLLLNALGIVRFHSAIGNLLTGSIFQIVLVAAVVLYIMHWETSKLWLCTSYALPFGLALVVLLSMWDAHKQHIFADDWMYYNNCFNIISNIYEDRALTVDGTGLSFQRFDTAKNQRFYMEPAEEDGLWHIVNQDSGRTLDVCNVVFEEGNSVIAWDKNGVVGQMWQLIPSAYGYQIMAYQDGYRLSYEGGNPNIVKITQNEEDLRSQFIVRQDLSTRLRSGVVCSGKGMIEIAFYGLLLSAIGVYGVVTAGNTRR